MRMDQYPKWVLLTYKTFPNTRISLLKEMFFYALVLDEQASTSGRRGVYATVQ